ncbi:MAG TPA: amino acid permease [Patescibacteria group bacterium]|nr:amino acid permease [Patescibacteria group bacterium]
MDSRSGVDRLKRAQHPDLVRGLGPWAATAIVVGTMIGTGIFIVPADMTRTAGTVKLVFAVWIAGGLLTLFGAFAYAELGAAIPEAGGEYAYIGRGFGPVWGFLFGWMHSIAGRTASIAAIAAGLLRFWGFLDPRVMMPLASLHFSMPWSAKPYSFVFTLAMPLAVAAIAAVTFINYLGVRLGGQVQIVLTVIKVAVIAAVIAVGFAFHGHPAALATPAGRAEGMGGFFAAMVAALWAYDGWANINLVGSEVIEPGRSIPRALVAGVAIVMVLYILTSAVCFYVLPFSQVAASPHVVSDAMARVAGSRAAAWITLAMVVCALGTLNSSILSGARVDYAMARDGLFFRVARGIHPRFRTPANALIFQGCLAAVLALTGTFEDLFSLFIFVQWIFYGLATASMMRLRRKEPGLIRPYRSWGYPVVPVIFILGAVAVTSSVLIERPLRAGLALVAILVGLFFYRRWRSEEASGGQA